MRVPCWVHIWADSTLMASVGSTDREDPNVDTQSGRFSEVALFKELSKAHKMAGRQVQEPIIGTKQVTGWQEQSC